MHVVVRCRFAQWMYATILCEWTDSSLKCLFIDTFLGYHSWFKDGANLKKKKKKWRHLTKLNAAKYEPWGMSRRVVKEGWEEGGSGEMMVNCTNENEIYELDVEKAWLPTRMMNSQCRTVNNNQKSTLLLHHVNKG